jgi:hypothetical protein
MARLLFPKRKLGNIIVKVLLIISIVITNSLIVFWPDDDRFYFSGLTSTFTLGAALVISITTVCIYKITLRKQKEKEKEQTISYESNDSRSHYYYDNNKIHFSICLFIAFWLVASVTWTFEDQEAPGILMADVLYYIGYASFGYFLYSLFYHFFRKEFEPFILILIAVIILIPLVLVVDFLANTLRLLSTQAIDISVLVVNTAYPILDAIMIFPLVIIFWAVRRQISRHRNANSEERVSKVKSKPSYLVHGNASMWILLLFIAMVLSAAGDIGFAYTSAFDVTTVQNYIWIWNIFYNSDHLCLAAALVGYRYLLSFSKIDT